MCSKLDKRDSSALPQSLNQEPPGAQQLISPSLNMPHLGHAVRVVIMEVGTVMVEAVVVVAVVPCGCQREGRHWLQQYKPTDF